MCVYTYVYTYVCMYICTFKSASALTGSEVLLGAEARHGHVHQLHDCLPHFV